MPLSKDLRYRKMRDVRLQVQNQVIVLCPVGARYHSSSFGYSSPRDLKVGWESDYMFSSHGIGYPSIRYS